MSSPTSSSIVVPAGEQAGVAAPPAAQTHDACPGAERHDVEPSVADRAVPRSAEHVTFVRYCDRSKIPIDLCYQCFGDRAAGLPTILLVCGLNMQLYAWDERFCESLAQVGFFVVRYDNRDIGFSTKIEQRGSVVGPRLLLPDRWASFLGERLPYTIEDMAMDGLALLDALRIPQAHVFGISMGGMIAQTMALIAPARVLSLTSIMSTTNARDLPDTQLWVKLWLLRKPPPNCTVEELLEFRINSLRRLLEHTLPIDTAYLKERFLISLRRSSYAAGLIRQAAAIRRCPSRDEALRRLRVPALVVHGAQDVLVPPVHGYRTAAVIPHARLLVLKSMGHYFHPAFFNTIILAFVDMTLRSAGGPSPRAMPAAEADETGAREAPCSPTRRVGSPTAAVTEQPVVGEHVMMASLAPLFSPVVASPNTKTFSSVLASVTVAVPRGTGHPATPEAVLVDVHRSPSSKAAARTPAGGAAAEEAAVPLTTGVPSTWDDARVPPAPPPRASEEEDDALPGILLEQYLQQQQQQPYGDVASAASGSSAVASHKSAVSASLSSSPPAEATQPHGGGGAPHGEPRLTDVADPAEVAATATLSPMMSAVSALLPGISPTEADAALRGEAPHAPRGGYVGSIPPPGTTKLTRREEVSQNPESI